MKRLSESDLGAVAETAGRGELEEEGELLPPVCGAVVGAVPVKSKLINYSLRIFQIVRTAFSGSSPVFQ